MIPSSNEGFDRLQQLFNTAAETLGLLNRKPSMDEGPEAMFRYLAGRDFEDFKPLIMYGLPSGMKPRLFFTPAVKGTALDDKSVPCQERNLTIVIAHYTATGGFYEEYGLNFETKTIEPGTISVDGDMAGLGLGRRAVANRGLMGQAVNFKHFSIYAGHEMGAYTWGKSGVEVTGDNGYEILSDLITGNLKLLKGAIPEDVYAQAHQLAQLKNKGDLRKFTQLDFDVSHCDQYFSYPQAFKKYVEKGFFKGKIGLGKFVMAGLAFDGAYDFNSKEQMDLFRDHVGGPVLLSEIKGLLNKRSWLFRPTEKPAVQLTPATA